jgi:predicted nucleotidyltransferase
VNPDYAAQTALLPDLAPVVAEYPHPLVFATVSGAHLYGFPSADSDIDLRGAHLLPIADLVALRAPVQTLSRMGDLDGVEMDLVTHDLVKFARLLLRPNGYVLEQLLSPLVVHTTQAHAELIDLVPELLTSRHADHYQGFAATQWKLFAKTGDLKPLLYTFRVLLSGIHLMRTGRLVAHLPALAEEAIAPAYLTDLIAAKANAEHLRLDQLNRPPDHDKLAADVLSLRTHLDEARASTHLPAETTAGPAVNDLVVQARLTLDCRAF